jgi:hypothetical protein
MAIRELLSWQWRGYPRYHHGRMNLLIHLVAVPVFMMANVLIIVAALRLSSVMLATGVVAVVLAVALEGSGHRRERISPEPFTGVGNFLGRFFIEQWVTFPRFVLSGGWWGNFTPRTKM